MQGSLLPIICCGPAGPGYKPVRDAGQQFPDEGASGALQYKIFLAGKSEMQYNAQAESTEDQHQSGWEVADGF
jgi:hypothetical protein